MRTFKRIGAKGALVLVTELPRQKKMDPQYHAVDLRSLRFGAGDSIEEAVDMACGV